MTKRFLLCILALITLFIFTSGCGRGNVRPDSSTEPAGTEQQVEQEPTTPEEREETVETEEETATADQAEVLPFMEDDMHGAGVRLGMTPQEVLSILGEPLSREEGLDEATDSPYLKMLYDFGYLFFYEYSDGYVLQVISISSPGFIGPRDIQLGDTMESVLAKFPMESTAIENNIQRLYGEEYDPEHWGIVQYYDDGSAEIFYVLDMFIGLRMPVVDNRIAEIIVLIAI